MRQPATIEVNREPTNMDPFNKLPAEIRLHIYLQLRLRSKGSILSIVQASAAMLNQYITSKAYIIKTSLTSDLDEEMIQDATRVILFSFWKTTIISYKVPGSFYHTWTAQQLPNPFETEDHELIAKIDKLHSRLLLFIEDYLTKATAIFPPREYLCLPDLSSIQGHLMFKNEIISPRFDAVHLTNQERKRLLRAFLRHELICKVNESKSDGETRLLWGSLLEYGGRPFQPSELEAIQCVHTYLQSLYGAMFAQCGDSWLPDIPEGTLSSHNTGLLYPDNIYVDANSYASDMAFHLSSPACFGFDLVTILLQSATSGRYGRDRLKLCFETGFTTRWTSFHWPRDHHGFAYRGFVFDNTGDMRQQESSGMYQMLSSRIVDGGKLQRAIYQQRAWVFLDDARLYPSFSPGPHFPTSDELTEHCTETARYEEWFTNPHATRAWHRSQACHEKRLPSGTDGEIINKPQDPGLETRRQTSLLPWRDASQEKYFGQLAPFWR